VLKQELIEALTTTTAPTPNVEPAKPAPVPAADVPEDYTGPHYSSPIPQDFLENLFQYCATEGTSSLVPRSYVDHIVRDAIELFKSEPTIVDIPLERDTKVIVVGDIHGQFPDLITILRDTGLPGPRQTIVFNGDFVDRGPAGVEVLLCLFCMKLQYPKNVYIHRGNHELESINRKYNFADQVITKYDDALFLLIQDCFAALPLGCVIAKKVLVIHGGLPEEPVSLNQIKGLPKLREDPTKATGGPEKLVQGILWSDPRDRRGARPSKRGAGVE
jgi:predicted phosphodiesterase